MNHFSLQEESSEISKMYIGLHVKYLLFLSNFNETGHFFETYSRTKFHENFYLVHLRCVCMTTWHNWFGFSQNTAVLDVL
jgi:hypothetical protein